MIGARRQELRSPMVPHAVQVQAKVTPGGGKLDAIKEETMRSQQRSRDNRDQTTRPAVRKNSI
jgi:hypothetical protein